MSKARPLCALVLLAACSESPSYALRWRITAADGTSAALTSIKQCTEVGVAGVRIHSRQDGVSIDVRDVPCFPDAFTDPEALFDGPELEPGAYTVLLEGLSRSGDTWEGVMSAEKSITVARGEPVILDDLRLPAPPQCDDGVDNDLDGSVDAADPGCSQEPPSESNDINSAQFFVRPTFFGDNPDVGCGDVDVDAFEIVVFGVVDGQPFVGPEQPIFPCGPSTLGLRVVLDPGVGYSVRVTGMRTVDGVNYQPVTAPITQAFDVEPDQGNYVVVDADFAASAFMPPIVSPISFVLEFEPTPGGEPRACQAGFYEGKLDLETVTIAVVDGAGLPVEPPVLLESGEALDGATPIPCPLAALRTEPLTWGEFQLVIAAAAPGGEICFANPEPIRAAPGSTVTVAIPRSSSAGACADCAVASECGSDKATCTDLGVCLPP